MLRRRWIDSIPCRSVGVIPGHGSPLRDMASALDRGPGADSAELHRRSTQTFACARPRC